MSDPLNIALMVTGGLLWGWLVGYGIGAVIEGGSTHGPLRIPVITPIVSALGRAVEWYYNRVVQLVELSGAAAERGIHKMMRIR